MLPERYNLPANFLARLPADLPYNDNELFAGIAAGDEQAFRVCFDRWYPTLYGASLHYLKVHEAAEDVVQQVFTRLWEKRAAVATIEKPLDYLFIMCRNECLDTLRRPAAKPGYQALTSEPFNPAAEGPGPEQQLVAKQIRELLQQAVNTLPPQQREVWTLVREKGYTYKQAADMTGLSPITIKAYLARATQKIAGFVRQHHPDLYSLLVASAFFS